MNEVLVGNILIRVPACSNAVKKTTFFRQKSWKVSIDALFFWGVGAWTIKFIDEKGGIIGYCGVCFEKFF